jgi:hypothetical protein
MSNRAGFVYLGIDATQKCIKIGRALDTKKREKEIRHMNPTFRIFYHYQPTRVTACEAEKYLHNLFAEKRVVGEWFDLSIDDLLIVTNGKGKYKLMSVLGRTA